MDLCRRSFSRIWIKNFPQDVPYNFAPALSGVELLAAEKKHAFLLLREIEGTLATLSVASLLTLPIYFLDRVLRTNGKQRVYGWTIL